MLHLRGSTTSLSDVDSETVNGRTLQWMHDGILDAEEHNVLSSLVHQILICQTLSFASLAILCYQLINPHASPNLLIPYFSEVFGTPELRTKRF